MRKLKPLSGKTTAIIMWIISNIPIVFYFGSFSSTERAIVISILMMITTLIYYIDY
ncbi:hypothetical protein [Shewanella sp. GutCb]|uniref:hypothetical protein n=1 Tax=Shewanella sp. GutCb TaxID=2058315 RepID=UPI0015E135A5|nr:hypothetical protein [Shewanella sp. GutCb]